MWSIKRTVEPVVELVELEELRRHLRLGDVNDHDATLLDLLLEAVRTCEVDRDETFLEATYRLRCDSFFENHLCYRGGLRIPGPAKPLLAISSIQYVDTAGVTQTLSSALYRVHTDDPYGWVEPEYGQSWPSVRSEANAVTITLTAGYGAAATDVPPFVRLAVKRLVAEWFEHREATVTGTINTQLPMSVRYLLDVNRVAGIG